MVANNICKDKDVHQLSDDTCRLLFTWLITFADCEGRTYGDPAIVKSTVYPRRTDITVEQIDGYLNELNSSGLILRYTAEDDLYILFPAFDKNQPGLRKDREPVSEIPPPPSAATDKYVRMFAGKKPDVCRMFAGLREVEVKLREVEENGSEGNRPPPAADPDLSGVVYKPLEVAFREKTGIYPPTGGGIPTHKWVDGFKKLVAQKATPEEIAGTIDDMRERGLSIAGPSSILNPLNIYRSKQNGNSIKPKQKYDTSDLDSLIAGGK